MHNLSRFSEKPPPHHVFKATLHLLFLFLALLTGCSQTPPVHGYITLDAKGEWKPTVYLVDPKTWDGVAASFVGVVLDSAAIGQDGHFVFEKMPDSPAPTLFELVVQKKAEANYPNRLDNENPGTSNYFPIVYKNGETVCVRGEVAQFQQSLSMKNPTAENAAMMQLRDARQAAFVKHLGQKTEGEHDAAALLDEEKAVLAYKQSIMDFAEQTPHLFPALVAARWVSVEGDYERIPEFIVAQAERWQKEAPQHPWVAQLAAKADRKSLPVLVGDVLPNYPMPLLSGDTMGLHALLKGKKLILLDLWASWCAPCRKENRGTLVPLYEQYSGVGFQVVGYALEASQAPWAAAIEKDGVGRWPHASDLQGDESPLFKELRMTTIPANFLVDEYGKVLAKNLHGEELVKWVEGYFNK
ncbi:MAG: TlpA family protein disulfide reductase [Saprospiraceae bacterium]|nr:TlpA family protein disulfide reductase [Saprospiraceae bacterium]